MKSYIRCPPTSKKMYYYVFQLFILGNVLIYDVSGHGRLIEPPSRASMWRYGFDNPPDYDDNQGYCGGYGIQWGVNNGKCGVCGDAWNLQEPRPHETGGKYGNGIIVKKYRAGSIVPIKVQITAFHKGYFEFRVCPVKQRGVEVTAECLNQNILIGADGKSKYYPQSGPGLVEVNYRLPARMTCEQCVLQWRYVAGNNWGDCGDGTGALGCGPQEEYRACADITISKT
ncbi:uncharacterized protein LOC124301279 [Neodiprion virginianus]|uniref:uncharacterized protein LOC124301279 n=1 Tax=Neodiprion virginianus TaxID=2961670 RepID=UPI001EE767C3|nr:uncharacterized protein LOC124301279 [Neodiprion virginianus]